MKHLLPSLLSLGLCLTGGACSFSFHASAGSKSSSRPAGSKTGKPAKPPKKKGPTKKKLHDEGGGAQPDQGGGEGGAQGDETPPDRQPTGDQGAQGQAEGTTLTARPTPDDPKNPDTVTNRAGTEHPKPQPKDVTARPKPTSPPSGPKDVKAPD